MNKRIIIGLIGVFLLLLSYALIPRLVFANPDLVDSYSETNQNSAWTVQGTHPSSNNDYSAFGQSFINVDTSKEITSCKFFLKKIGSPTGNVNAVLYAHTGTYGTDSKPINEPLAISNNFEVADITSDFTLITFTFSGDEQYEMLADTYYCIVFQEENVFWSGGYIHVGIDTTSPAHDGNSLGYKTSAWISFSLYDVCFYVYGEVTAPPDNEPFYSNVGYDGKTQVGLSSNFWCYWEDDFELDTCWFSTNNTGTWVNSSILVSGIASWANKTIQLNFTANIRIEYKWYCSDNASQWNYTTPTDFLVTTSLYVTFNLNNSTMGKFYVDYTDTENETQNAYDYNQNILLDGIPLNSSYVWNNFTWTGGNSVINNYEYSTSGNNTVWCNFGLSEDGIGGIDESYFVLGFVITGCSILFMVIVIKGENKGEE